MFYRINCAHFPEPIIKIAQLNYNLLQSKNETVFAVKAGIYSNYVLKNNANDPDLKELANKITDKHFFVITVDFSKGGYEKDGLVSLLYFTLAAVFITF